MLHLMKDGKRRTQQPVAKVQGQLPDKGKRSNDRLYWCQLSPAPIIKLQWTHHMTAVGSAHSINKDESMLNSLARQTQQ